MENFLLILKHLRYYMPFLGKSFNGPLKFIIVQIIGFLIYKITETTDHNKAYNKILNDKFLMDNLINEIAIIDNKVKNQINNMEKLEKPNWLIIESWVFLSIITFFIILFIIILFTCKLNKIINGIILFIIFILMFSFRTIINYRFAKDNNNKYLMEILLIKELIALCSYKIK